MLDTGTNDAKANIQWRILLAQTEIGNPESAALTGRLIGHFSPNAILLIGVAGSLSNDVQIFDVVVATDVTYYERAKIGQNYIPRHVNARPHWALLKQAEFHGGDTTWADRIKSPHPNEVPRVHIRPIVAGEKVLVNSHSNLRRQIWPTVNKVAAIEMEGYSFLTTIYRNEVPGLIIRGISDILDDKNTDAFGVDIDRQSRAAHHASAFAMEALRARLRMCSVADAS